MQAILDLVGQVMGLLELDEFRVGLLAAVRAAVPADWISLNDIAPDPRDTVVLIEPAFAAAAHVVYARFAHENPLLQRFQASHDGRAYRFSDVCTVEELHATNLYREFYASIGLEHQIALTLPSGPDRILALALSRADRDFDDAERDLLNAVRPFLIQAYRNAIEFSNLKHEAGRAHGRPLPLTDPWLEAALRERGVTPRQGEILSWVATGRSSRAIAEQLGLSERTVHKHLQVCFAALGVESRGEAVDLAWSFVGRDP